jgi:N-acetylmuramoyl-L-alanine amidase
MGRTFLDHASWRGVLLTAAFILMLLVTSPVRAADPAGAVRIETAGGGARIVLSLPRRSPMRASIDAPARRLDIDIDEAIAFGGAGGSASGLARAYHVERKKNGCARVTVELARSAIIDGMRWAPKASGRGFQAVIALSAADPIAMRAISGVVYRPEPLSADASAASIGALIQASAPRYLAPPRVDKPDAAGPLRLAPESSQRPGGGPAAKAIGMRSILSGSTGKKTIVIDAGHGGIDPGAESIVGYNEKEVTLATARILKRVLDQTGRYAAVLTREGDIYLKLQERVARARAAHGDLFVSLHADSVAGGEGDARGASIYTLSETASDVESERYAQRENRADALGGGLGNQSDDVAGILVDLTVRETVNDGNRLANLLVDAMAHDGVAFFPRLPHRSAGFAVLKAPDIPSVLVEMGYLSDRSDARALADPRHQLEIAKGIAAGIDRYFAWVQATR